MEAVSLSMDTFNKNLFNYIEIIYRRKWTLIIPSVLCTAAAVLISFTLPPYYQSNTLILVEQQLVPERYVTSTDRTPIDQRLRTIRQQIMSRNKLGQIIDDFKLYREDETKGEDSLFTKAMKFLQTMRSGKPTRDDLIEQMRNDMEIKVIGGSAKSSGGDAFSITYTGRDPLITMQVTNTLASLFMEENLKLREQFVEGTSEFLVSEVEKAKNDIEEQENVLRLFKEKNMGSLPEQLDANLRTLDRLQLELRSVNDAIKNSEDRKTLLEEQLGLIPAARTGVARVNPLEEELSKLKRDLATLQSMYKENYPDVIITRNRIKELEEALSKSAQKDARGQEESSQEAAGANSALYADLRIVKSQIQVLKQRDADIRKQIKALEKKVEDAPANEQKLADIRRDYEISLRNYQSLLEKKLSARLAENLEKKQKGEKFRVIDPANLPEKPYKPDKPKIILIGMAAGLGVGMGLVFLFESLNPAFRRPEDLVGALNHPVLAIIPVFSGKPAERPKKRLKVIKGRNG